MGRRRKISTKKRSYKRIPKESNTSKRKRMLDMRNHSDFKYDLKKTLEGMAGSDPVFANVNSKSINIGTDEAKKYVEDLVNQESIDRKKADEIIALLDRYSKFR
jgi:hypothetical protein